MEGGLQSSVHRQQQQFKHSLSSVPYIRLDQYVLLFWSAVISSHYGQVSSKCSDGGLRLNIDSTQAGNCKTTLNKLLYHF